jgi:hypothetical protein
MHLKCQQVSVSEAGDEIFDVMFEGKKTENHTPYVLIQRAFLEEDDGEPSPIYLETHDTNLIGHYPRLNAALTRNRFIITLPPPEGEIIEVDFRVSEKQFRKLRDALGIIMQEYLRSKDPTGVNDAESL